MTNKGPLYDQIEAFLRDQLDAEAGEAMRQAIARDPELAREVTLRRLEFELSEALIADQIRTQLQGLRADAAPGQPPGPRYSTRKRYFFWLIAALLGIAAIGVYRHCAQAAPLPPTAPPTDRQIPPPDTNNPLPQAGGPSSLPPTTPAATALALATELYQAPHFETLRAAQTPANDPIETALSAWNAQEYGTVLAALQSVPDSDPQYLRAATLRAHAQFNLKQYGLAAAGFRSIARSRVMPWAEEAEWYLLLALAANGQSGSSECTTRLARLCADSAHPFAEQALVLRRRLGTGR